MCWTDEGGVCRGERIRGEVGAGNASCSSLWYLRFHSCFSGLYHMAFLSIFFFTCVCGNRDVDKAKGWIAEYMASRNSLVMDELVLDV